MKAHPPGALLLFGQGSAALLEAAGLLLLMPLGELLGLGRVRESGARTARSGN